jgi:hypothetical protein
MPGGKFTPEMIKALAATNAMSPEDYVDSIPNRIIMSVASPTKHGKTHWAMSASKPLVYMQLEDGSGEGVIDKDKFDFSTIRPAEYKFRRPVNVKGQAPKEIKNEAEKVWAQFTNDFRVNLRLKGLRTIVVDTGNEAFDLAKLAECGTIAPYPAILAAPAKRAWGDLIRMAFDYDKNVILATHLADIYEGDQRTGSKKLRGMAEIAEICQINLRIERLPVDDKGVMHRKMTITECRFAEEHNGFEKNDMSFQEMACIVRPDTDFEDWE